MEQIYAVIENGAVINTIVATDAFIAEFYPAAVRVDNLSPVPAIGWTYAAGVFTAPPVNPPPPVVKPRVYTRYAFRNLFTLDEQVLMDNTDAMPDSDLPPASKAIMRTLRTNFQVAEEIDLDDPMTQIGIAKLEEFGLIAPGRAADVTSL